MIRFLAATLLISLVAACRPGPQPSPESSPAEPPPASEVRREEPKNEPPKPIGPPLRNPDAPRDFDSAQLGVELYPGSKLVPGKAFRSESQGVISARAQYELHGADADEVAAHYASQLKTPSSLVEGTARMVSGIAISGERVTVSISPEPGGLMVYIQATRNL